MSAIAIPTTTPAGGGELDYVQITANGTTTATNFAGATTILTANAVVFDGATAVIIEFWAVTAAPLPDEFLQVVLTDGGTDIGTLCYLQTTASGADTEQIFSPLYGMRRLTPTAASHTYAVAIFGNGAGTKTVFAGAGGAGTNPPAFLRITRAA